MSLWVDKYRPGSLDQLDYHASVKDQLSSLAEKEDFPHLLFYGPSGAGKKTRIQALLRHMFGSSVDRLKIEPREFTTPSKKKLEINIISSHYHIEVTPSDVGIYDRVVIQDLIKDLAQTQQVDSSAPRQFKVVVINEAESLTKDAQSALRRTMEKYMHNLRVILCCSVTSRIIAPIRSRCLLIRIGAPSVDDIAQVLGKVSQLERFRVPQSLLLRVANEANGNLRRALLMLETIRVQHPNPTEATPIPSTDWECFVREIAKTILTDQTPKTILDIRSKLYQLIANCIPAETILKTLAFDLLKLVDASNEALKKEILSQAAEFEHRLRLGNKAIFHLEAFVIRVACLYSQSLFGF